MCLELEKLQTVKAELQVDLMQLKLISDGTTLEECLSVISYCKSLCH